MTFGLYIFIGLVAGLIEIITAYYVGDLGDSSMATQVITFIVTMFLLAFIWPMYWGIKLIILIIGIIHSHVALMKVEVERQTEDAKKLQ